MHVHKESRTAFQLLLTLVNTRSTVCHFDGTRSETVNRLQHSLLYSYPSFCLLLQSLSVGIPPQSQWRRTREPQFGARSVNRAPQGTKPPKSVTTSIEADHSQRHRNRGREQHAPARHFQAPETPPSLPSLKRRWAMSTRNSPASKAQRAEIRERYGHQRCAQGLID